MPTRKEDNDFERQVRIDAMIEAHQKLLERAARAKAFVQLAKVRARVAQALAIQSRQLGNARLRPRKRA
jgi:hypothetical protein